MSSGLQDTGLTFTNCSL